MIGRRMLLAGMATIAAAPCAVAQQSERRRVVAIVLESSSPAEMAGPDPVSITARALIHGLRDLGWIEGRNLIIARRTAANQPDRALPIMAELVGRGVDVIMISGAEWLVDAARRTTSTVPLVVTFPIADPAAMGVKSLARPGGNLTGSAAVTGIELAGKRLEILKELAPNTRRIAWLGTELNKQRYPPDSGPAGTRIVHAVAETLDQFDDAFALILREGCNALYVGGSGVHFVHRSKIIAFAAANRLPAMYCNRQAVDEGGLVAYGPSVLRRFAQMAELADRILRGERPGDLPIQLPDRFDLVINRKTAETLELTIPPSLEALAEVLE